MNKTLVVNYFCSVKFELINKKMKNLILTLVFALITSFSFANEKENVKETKQQLREKIGGLLGNYQQLIKNDTDATIKFVINRQGQIVVLSVDTNVGNLDTYIKSKLNYKKTDIKNVKFFETYTVPVKFIKL